MQQRKPEKVWARGEGRGKRRGKGGNKKATEIAIVLVRRQRAMERNALTVITMLIIMVEITMIRTMINFRIMMMMI